MSTLVILYVEDLDRARAFYRAVLGVEPVLDVPGMVEFPLPGALLGLMPASGIRRLLPGLDTGDARVSRAELYLLLPDAEQVHARALAAGATELSPFADRPWGDRVAYSRDADGHVLAVGSGSLM